MQKLVWQNANGVELDLTSGNYGITEWEGFSNASLNIQSQQVPFQDGGVFLDALIEQRELSVTLAIQDNNNLELRYQKRRELISALNPKLGEGYLIYTNDFISKRIKCIPQIPLFETHNSNDTGTPKASLSWTACEPYWEDLEDTVVDLVGGETTVIENEGDIASDVEIVLNTISNGNISTPSIKNLTNGKIIEINKNELYNQIKIDTRTGKKKVIEESYQARFLGGYDTILDIAFISHLGFYLCGLENSALWKTKDFESFENYVVSGPVKKIVYSEEKEECLILVNGVTSGIFLYKTTDFETYTSIILPSSITQNSARFVYGYYSESLHKYVISSTNGTFTTEDCSSWTQTNNQPLTNISSYGNYIIGTVGGIIYNTTDLSTWGSINTGINSDIVSLVEKSEKLYALYSNAKIASSSGLSDWQEETLNITPQGNGSCITIINNNFYIIFSTSNGIKLYKGVTLDSLQEMNPPATQILSGFRKLVQLSSIGMFLLYDEGFTTTYNFNSYNYYKTPNENLYYNKTQKKYIGISYVEGIDQIHRVLTSSDLKKWEEQKALETILPTSIYGNTEYDTKTNTIYVSLVKSSEGYIYTSQDLINYSLLVQDDISGRIKIANEILFHYSTNLTSGEFRIRYTNNNVDWEETTISVTGSGIRIIDMCYGNNKYYVLTSNGKIYESEDLESWEEKATLSGMGYYSIFYSEKEELLFVGGQGSLYVSEDETNWVRIPISGNVKCFLDSKIFNTVIFGSGAKLYKYNNINKTADILINTLVYSSVAIEGLVEEEGKIVWTNFYGLYTTIVEDINIINYLSSNSDINFKLEQGSNKVFITSSPDSTETIMGSIKYRQKYIGV
ncbi:MAG: phage tail family protein [Methanobrevibacter sp.]|nr:phage tail family protein [Methanobrevibacter sp.]